MCLCSTLCSDPFSRVNLGHLFDPLNLYEMENSSPDHLPTGVASYMGILISPGGQRTVCQEIDATLVALVKMSNVHGQRFLPKHWTV